MRKVLILAAVITVGIAGAVSAANSTTFQVTASVAANCTISATNLAFGVYDPLAGADTTGTGSVTIACVQGISPTVALSLGSYGNRTMRGVNQPTPDSLAYHLYLPDSYSWTDSGTCPPGSPVEWNDTNTLAPGGAPSNQAATFNVCGAVPAGQDVKVDNYADSVTATVNF
jgi:spore coat protein U-like protein